MCPKPTLCLSCAFKFNLTFLQVSLKHLKSKTRSLILHNWCSYQDVCTPVCKCNSKLLAIIVRSNSNRSAQNSYPLLIYYTGLVVRLLLMIMANGITSLHFPRPDGDWWGGRGGRRGGGVLFCPGSAENEGGCGGSRPDAAQATGEVFTERQTTERRQLCAGQCPHAMMLMMQVIFNTN